MPRWNSHLISPSTYSPAAVTESVVLHAFKTGYRHIDSARAYRNEQPCAEAIRSTAHSIPRAEIFFTSKVPPRAMGYEATMVRIPSPLVLLVVLIILSFFSHFFPEIYFLNPVANRTPLHRPLPNSLSLRGSDCPPRNLECSPLRPEGRPNPLPGHIQLWSPPPE